MINNLYEVCGSGSAGAYCLLLFIHERGRGVLRRRVENELEVGGGLMGNISWDRGGIGIGIRILG